MTPMETRGNVDEITPEQWLAEQFEFELCENCGGDESDHIAVGLDLGAYGANWFAYCKFPPYLADTTEDLLWLASDVQSRRIVGIDDSGDQHQDPRDENGNPPRLDETETTS